MLFGVARAQIIFCPMPELYSVAIFVSDIERAKKFYRDDLELAVTREGSFGAELLDGSSHISLVPANHPEARPLVGRHTGITLQVEGILDFCERLHERKVKFVAEPTKQGFGVMAMIADPDGNILALWDAEVPEHVAHAHG
jgi:predicted enzyme related to lactoylglutathione lyase